MLKKVLKYLNDVFGDIGKRNLDAFSAQAAFFTFVSLIPFCALLFSILKFIPFADYDVVGKVMATLPKIASDIILGVYESAGSYPAGAVIPIAIFLTLWAASKGIFAIMRGIHSAYGDENVNSARDRVRSILYTLIFIVMVIISLIFVAFGNTILAFLRSHLPRLKEITFIKEGIRLLLLTAFVAVVHLLLYMFSSDKRKKLRYVWQGAVIAGAGWTVVSYFYSLYLDYYLSVGNTLYGDLATVVFLLLWLYACMFTTLIGSFVNRRITEYYENRS